MMFLNHFLLPAHNNLTLARILLACSVIAYHALALTGADPAMDPIRRLSGFISTGGLAVALFFLLSGMLVCNSLRHHASVGYFTLARLLRVMPGLIVLLLVTVLLVGPSLTSLPLVDYVRHPLTLDYLWGNVRFDTRYTLPGLFVNNPYPDVVNGSLWTLRWELACYGGLALAGLFGLTNSRALATLLCLVVCYGVVTHHPWLTHYLGQQPTMLRLPCYFAFGCLLALWQHRLPLDWLAVVTVLLCWAVRATPAFDYLFVLAAASMLLWLCSLPRVVALHIQLDISYGVYIYGFLVQQLVAFYLPALNWSQHLLLALPASIFCGYLSFRFIEQPCIRFGKRFQPEPTASG
ncbi:acyltransferase family protein [Aeromonas veronii]|uniref:acyltransferase family protein n=1 Tax=Aeromonas veronii TaxID=654 RepID=UPI0002805F63|nr:acyltransferase [Aeromonas veronii]EKB12460.1 hypothetical protein HMPREF1167_02498 [Aeromonas veronii AER39]